MIIDKAGKGLRTQLEQSYKDLKHAKTAEEKVAISNYIGNLYMALACMGNPNIKVDKKRCFGSQKNYNKFIKRINIYDDQLINNFLLHKEFHHQYMGEILPTVEEELIEVEPITFKKESISKEEIFAIIREFTKSIKQDALFDDLYNSKKFHSTMFGDTEDNLGFTYDTLDRYIRTGEIEDLAIKEKVDTLHKRNLFKLSLMPSFIPEE